MRKMLGSTRGRFGVILGIVALLALVGASCRPVQAPGVEIQNPTGRLEAVVGGSGVVRVTGWASQWDLFVDGAFRDQGPVLVVVNVNGQWVKGAFPADDTRTDVHWWLGVAGFQQIMQDDMGYGFDVTVPAPKGSATVCVAALNQNLDLEIVRQIGGDHVLLGCRTVTVS